jgi:hypothetical protein
MEFRQPCEVNRFTFKRHAIGHLLRNGLPTQLLSRGGRQQLPALNGFNVTHAGKITAFTRLSNTIHAGSGKSTRLPRFTDVSYASRWVHRVHHKTINQKKGTA